MSSSAVKPALAPLDFLKLLEGAARVALPLRGTDRLVLCADPLLLEADLLLLHADLLLLQAPALGVVSGTSILILGTLRAVLDALDGLPDALLLAPALGKGAARGGNDETENPRKNQQTETIHKRHKLSFHISVGNSRPWACKIDAGRQVQTECFHRKIFPCTLRRVR